MQPDGTQHVRGCTNSTRVSKVSDKKFTGNISKNHKEVTRDWELLLRRIMYNNVSKNEQVFALFVTKIITKKFIFFYMYIQNSSHWLIGISDT